MSRIYSKGDQYIDKKHYSNVHEMIDVSSIPRDVHLVFLRGWLQARMQALLRNYENLSNVL